MKLLLEENLPKRMKSDFPDHEIYTVREQGWNGIKNGELMKLLVEEGFNALLTFDKNLRYQQNFIKYPIAVFILSANNNTYQVLTKLSPKIQDHLNKKQLVAGAITITQ